MTIENDHQYKITREQLERFRKAAIVHKAHYDSFTSEILILEGQLAEYRFSKLAAEEKD